MRRDGEREREEFTWKLGGTEREKAASHLDRRSAGVERCERRERRRKRGRERGTKGSIDPPAARSLTLHPRSLPILPSPTGRLPRPEWLAPFHFASLPSLSVSLSLCLSLSLSLSLCLFLSLYSSFLLSDGNDPFATAIDLSFQLPSNELFHPAA